MWTNSSLYPYLLCVFVSITFSNGEIEDYEIKAKRDQFLKLSRNCWNTDIFLFIFSRVRTEYGDLPLDFTRKSPNTGKYGAERTQYSFIFQALLFFVRFISFCVCLFVIFVSLRIFLYLAKASREKCFWKKLFKDPFFNGTFRKDTELLKIVTFGKKKSF